MQYFECMVPKTFLFMPPLFKKQKSYKSLNLSYPGSRKVLTSAKIMIPGQKCCRYLMMDSVKYLCAQFGYGPMASPDLFNLQKGQPVLG